MGFFDFFRRRQPAQVDDPHHVSLVDAFEAARYRLLRAQGKAADDAFGIHERRVQTRARWRPCDRDIALAEAENGVLLRLAMLLDFMRSDGLISGLMGQRTSGLLRLPKTFCGDPLLVQELAGKPAIYSESGALLDPGIEALFPKMCPSAELSAIMWDGLLAGVGLGELVPNGNNPPFLAHRDLHWLVYRHTENSWQYLAPSGSYEVRPGDGRWFLFTPWGRRRPWIKGRWFPCAYPAISKYGTNLDRLRWQSTFSDPLRVIESSQANDEPQREKLLDFIENFWQRAPGLVTTPNEKVYLAEASGDGYAIYEQSEERADLDIMIAIVGQTVTAQGGKGFSSGEVWADILAALHGELGESLAEHLREQVFAPWVERWHSLPRSRAPEVSWDTRTPSHQKAEAEAAQAEAGATKARADALATLSDAATKADQLLAGKGKGLDVERLFEDYGVDLPIVEIGVDAPAVPSAPPGPADEPEVDHAARLAAEMTEHGVDRCEHGRSNRCPLCGVERERAVIPGVDGAPAGWKLAWKPLAQSVG